MRSGGLSSEQRLGLADVHSNLIAEHQLPRSGIEHVVDRMALPSCHAGGAHESHAMLNWLAELAVRRLLNRVHHAMYAGDAACSSTAALIKVSTELNQQLDVWFQTLPPTIRPELSGSPDCVTSNPFELHLLHRYHTAKDIIFRPFVFYAHGFSVQPIPDLILEKAGTCLYHCRAYLSVADALLPLPSTSREIIMHSVFSATVVLTLGSLTPQLAHLVSDIRRLQSTAVACFGHFAWPGSSVETMLWILQALQAKTRLLGGGRSGTFSNSWSHTAGHGRVTRSSASS